MAAPRLLADPDALHARIPYAEFLKSTNHIQGRVTGLGDTRAKVLMADGTHRSVSFDFAVIATGSVTLDPLIKAQAATQEERAKELEQHHARLQSARSIVIVGADPVGVETAAELREAMPGVDFTIIHSHARLLDKAPGKFAAWAKQFLEDQGVHTITGERVTSPEVGEQPKNGKVQTSTGRVLPADVVIWAAGIRPITGFIANSWPDVVDGSGLVKVDSHLRVVNHPSVFAVGDIASTPEDRLAIIAGLHVKSVVANLKALVAADGQTKVTLKPYKPAVPGQGAGKLMIVSLGRKDGLTSLPFGQFRAPFMARKIKSHDMLVGMSRKALKLK